MKGIKFEEVGKSAIVQQWSIDSDPNAGDIEISAGPFNSRGVVTDPAFVMARPAGQDDQIEFSIKAHPVADSKWIAEPSWHSNARHTPGHSQQPSIQSAAFQTRSEAVENAINRGIRQIIGEFGELVDTPDWKRRLKSLRAWAATAMEQVRAADETLPLRGVSVIDLACGGLGGFGMGLVSLGAHVTLACDIDDRARDVYQQNVRPERMHGDLCSLDGKGLSCDILTMGLMCQAFSRAGNALGMADPKLADAYKHSMRLLTEIDAKVVIIECVRQLGYQDKDGDMFLPRGRDDMDALYQIGDFLLSDPSIQNMEVADSFEKGSYVIVKGIDIFVIFEA